MGSVHITANKRAQKVQPLSGRVKKTLETMKRLNRAPGAQLCKGYQVFSVYLPKSPDASAKKLGFQCLGGQGEIQIPGEKAPSGVLVDVSREEMCREWPLGPQE